MQSSPMARGINMVPPEAPWTRDYVLVSVHQKWALLTPCLTEQSRVQFKKEASAVCLEFPALRSLSFVIHCILP